jgi:hypothetical protein
MLRAFTKNLFSQIASQEADKGAATAVDCTPGAMARLHTRCHAPWAAKSTQGTRVPCTLWCKVNSRTGLCQHHPRRVVCLQLWYMTSRCTTPELFTSSGAMHTETAFCTSGAMRRTHRCHAPCGAKSIVEAACVNTIRGVWSAFSCVT